MPSKRFKKLPENTNTLPSESFEKLVSLVKQNCTTKFDESIDLSFQINNKQKKNEINIRTAVNLPGGTGKTVKVAVVCEDNKSQEAKDAGADTVGGDEFVEKIKGGVLNFEKLICTPGMMIKLSKLGKVLGPKGLMPNPKLGSVTNDLAKAVSDAKSGQVEIRNDKEGNIGVSIGKKSFDDEKLRVASVAGNSVPGKFGSVVKSAHMIFKYLSVVASLSKSSVSSIMVGSAKVSTKAETPLFSPDGVNIVES